VIEHLAVSLGNVVQEFQQVTERAGVVLVDLGELLLRLRPGIVARGVMLLVHPGVTVSVAVVLARAHLERRDAGEVAPERGDEELALPLDRPGQCVCSILGLLSGVWPRGDGARGHGAEELRLEIRRGLAMRLDLGAVGASHAGLDLRELRVHDAEHGLALAPHSHSAGDREACLATDLAESGRFVA
jgi:hypothetical protein